VFSAAEREFGHVDIRVTNAAGPPAGPFGMHTSGAWEEALRTNLMSVVELVHGVLPGCMSGAAVTTAPASAGSGQRARAAD
jgi:hypothetical protein